MTGPGGGSRQAFTISVVVCTYTEDRWNRMVAAVASASAQTASPLETIVVVDHNPELLDRVRAELGDVVAVPNAGARGLSDGRNTGVATARGSVVAFLDDDAEAAPDWLANLAAHFERPEVIGVGGTVVAAWPDGRPSWFPDEFDWVVGCSYRGLPRTAAPVRNLIGANMSFRRSVFEAVGGFDSRLGRVARLPAGCEETEFCVRARRDNPTGVILYDPGAVVVHHIEATRTSREYFRARCYNEGISKAMVARLAGGVAPLSVEAQYVTNTLAGGACRALWSRVTGADPHGAARAAAMVVGLMQTAAGYAVGVSRSRRAVKGATASPTLVPLAVEGLPG